MDALSQAAELLASGAIKAEPRTGSAFSAYVRPNGGVAKSSALTPLNGGVSEDAGAAMPQDSCVQPMDAALSVGTAATGLLRPTPTAVLPSYSAVVNSLASKSEAAREAAHSLRLEQSGLVAAPHPLAAAQPVASLHQLLQAMYSQQLLQPVQQALLLNGAGVTTHSPRAGVAGPEQLLAYQPMQLQHLQQAQWAAAVQQQAQAQAHSTPSPAAARQESTPELAQEQRPSHSPPAQAVQPQQQAGEVTAGATTVNGGGDLVAAADAFRMHAPLTGQQLQELTGQQGFRDEMKAMMDGMDAEGSGMDGEREGDGAGGSSDTEDEGAGAANGLANGQCGSKAMSGAATGGTDEGSGQDEMDAQQAADELMEVLVASETEKGCSAYLPVPYMGPGLRGLHNGASSRGCGQLTGQKRKAPAPAESDIMAAGMELAGAAQAGMASRMGAGVGVGLNGRSKKPRLIWTAELHARFLNAVNTLGVKNAVPKTILQLMNVEGMTRENVASHLQKYRLYLKRCSNLPPGTVPPDAFAQMMGGASHMFGAQPLHQANASVLAPMQLGATAAPAVAAAKPAPTGPMAAATGNSPVHQTPPNGPTAVALQQVQQVQQMQQVQAASKPAASGQPDASGVATAAVVVAPMTSAAPSSLEMLGAALTSQMQAQQLQQLQAAMAAAANGGAGSSQGMLVAGGAGPLALLSAASRGLDPLGALANGRALQVPMSLALPLSGYANGLLTGQAAPSAASAPAPALSLLPATMGGNMMSLLQAAGSQHLTTQLHQQLHALAAQQLVAQASGLSTCSNNNQGPQVVSQAVS